MSTQLAEVAEQKQASPSSEREGDEYSMTEVHLSEHDIDSDSDSDIVLKPSPGNGKVNNSFGQVSQPGGTFQVDWRNIKVCKFRRGLVLPCLVTCLVFPPVLLSLFDFGCPDAPVSPHVHA